MSLKLDLGAGSQSPDGFVPLGNVNGTQIYPLASIPDGAADEIRASHVLEHFSHREVQAVVNEWVRALKPGGVLKIAVPDFTKIAEAYSEGAELPIEGYVMGGQVDQADFHKALFNEATLKRILATAGLVLIKPWVSEFSNDCAALPISLNLCGVKPHMSGISVSAVMSLPRITWTANSIACFEALPPLGIKFRSVTGAYWGQCLERGLEQALEDDNPDAVMTLDFDTVFTRREAATLMQLMMVHPEVDAVTAVQSGRGTKSALFTVRGEEGKNATSLSRESFAGDLTKVATAHFGLTLIRAEKLRDLPKPWFHDVPSPNGDWGDGRIDADIAFWRKWEAVGNSLYIANRVTVGHLEAVVMWPGQNLEPIYQPHNDWRNNGKPEGSWT